MIDLGGIVDDVKSNIDSAVDDVRGNVDNALDDLDVDGTIRNTVDDAVHSFTGGGRDEDEGQSGPSPEPADGGGSLLDNVTDGVGDLLDGNVSGAIDNALDFLGMDAPDANEDALATTGNGWSHMAERVTDVVGVGDHIQRTVGDNNSGNGIASFLDSFTGRSQSPVPGGQGLANGLAAGAAALFGSAGAVQGAKTTSLTEGSQFLAKQAQALADAPATGGQSLSLIPGFFEEHRGKIHNAANTASDFLSGDSGGPAGGIIGDMLAGTGLIERLDQVADATAPEPPPAPGAPVGGPGAPVVAPAPAPNGNADALVQSYVDRQIPYAWGGGHGAEPGMTQGISDGGGAADAHGDYNKVGLDCSGLARDFLYNYKGIDIGAGSTHTTIDQGTPVAEEDLQVGDLVYPHSGHVQVYIGDGEVLEAKQSGTDVMTSPYEGGELRRYE